MASLIGFFLDEISSIIPMIILIKPSLFIQVGGSELAAKCKNKCGAHDINTNFAYFQTTGSDKKCYCYSFPGEPASLFVFAFPKTC